MGRLQLNVPGLQRSQNRAPDEQMLQILGQNPYAEGLKTVGDALSTALAKRMELRKQMAQVSKAEKAFGLPAGSLQGLPLENASSIGTKVMEENTKRDQKAKDQAAIRLLESQNGYKSGELGDDLATARFTVGQRNIGDRQDKSIQSAMERMQQAQAIQEEKGFKGRINTQKYRLVNDPRVKPLFTQGVGLGQVDDILNIAKQGNTVAAAGLGVKMARAMGEVGVLTDSDVTRYVQSGRLDRKAADTLSRWIRGMPTDATMQELSQITNVLRENFGSKVQPVYNEYIDSAAQLEGKTPDEISRYMGLPYKPAATLRPIERPATHKWNQKTGRVEVIQ